VYLEADIKRIFDGKRVLIAGMGREGKSAQALLERLGVCTEVDTAENNEAIRTALTDKIYDMVVKSPGVPMFVLRDLCRKTEVTSMTDVFLRVYGDQVIGVTGTKGKSTTTSLIYNVFKTVGYNVLLGGNIGIPLFELVEKMDLSTIVVAELSCHQLENIHRGPHIGVLLNLFQEHLDHYESYDGYKMAKMQIGLRQCDGDTFIYCKDNAELATMVEAYRGQFRSQIEAYSADDEPLYGRVFSRLPGEHNRSNIEAVAHVARLYCIDGESFRQAVTEFRGLEHRLEYVGAYKGIKFYNDSISTIPAACEAAVKAVGGVQTLILGGFDRGIDYSGLIDFVANSEVENIAFVGAAGDRMYELAKAQWTVEGGKNIIRENDYGKIVEWCFKVTEAGKVCLLSPAAASYDSFKNFEERGRVFKDLVRCHVRHELHAHPGLSGNEAFAHDMIVESLKVYKDCTVFSYVGDAETASIDGQDARETGKEFFGRVSGYGVVAVFGDNPDAPTIALRADTDALPIDECGHESQGGCSSENIFEIIDGMSESTESQPHIHSGAGFCSTVRGVSHKCGHDGHTSIMLRVADMIAQSPAVYADKNIMLIFQPEEETGRGSQKILDSGIMQRYNIHAVYGMHNIPGEPLGEVLLSSGTFAAASVGMKYKLIGRQTHASTPEKGINPGRAVAQIIERFEELNCSDECHDNREDHNNQDNQNTSIIPSILTPWRSKNRNNSNHHNFQNNQNNTIGPDNQGGTSSGFTQSTLICVRLGEETYGTSAGCAEVMFTLRAFSNKRMSALREKADGIVSEVCEKYGLQLEISECDPFKATENDSRLTDGLEKIFTQAGFALRRIEKPFRWSEDFANYLMYYRGAFFGIGSGQNCPELHHPAYDFPDALIEPASECFMAILASEL